MIFNLLGDKVKTIQRKNQGTGYYNFKWDAKDNSGATVSAGTYVYQIKAGKFISSYLGSNFPASIFEMSKISFIKLSKFLPLE